MVIKGDTRSLDYSSHAADDVIRYITKVEGIMRKLKGELQQKCERYHAHGS